MNKRYQYVINTLRFFCIFTSHN